MWIATGMRELYGLHKGMVEEEAEIVVGIDVKIASEMSRPATR
jgi:hypothetical protein